MKWLWQKIRSVKGWWLIFPVVIVGAGLFLRLGGRGIFGALVKKPEKPTRYITPEFEAEIAKAIKVRDEVRAEGDQEKVDAAMAERDSFWEGDS
jgi:hypothetical protein